MRCGTLLRICRKGGTRPCEMGWKTLLRIFQQGGTRWQTLPRILAERRSQHMRNQVGNAMSIFRKGGSGMCVFRWKTLLKSHSEWLPSSHTALLVRTALALSDMPEWQRASACMLGDHVKEREGCKILRVIRVSRNCGRHTELQ